MNKTFYFVIKRFANCKVPNNYYHRCTKYPRCGANKNATTNAPVHTNTIVAPDDTSA